MYAKRRACAQQQRRIRSRAASHDAYAFFNVLTSPELLDEVESLLPAHRERVFPPTETLSMFLSQALSADRSCQQVVNEAAVKRLVGGLSQYPYRGILSRQTAAAGGDACHAGA